MPSPTLSLPPSRRSPRRFTSSLPSFAPPCFFTSFFSSQRRPTRLSKRWRTYLTTARRVVSFHLCLHLPRLLFHVWCLLNPRSRLVLVCSDQVHRHARLEDQEQPFGHDHDGATGHSCPGHGTGTYSCPNTNCPAACAEGLTDVGNRRKSLFLRKREVCHLRFSSTPGDHGRRSVMLPSVWYFGQKGALNVYLGSIWMGPCRAAGGKRGSPAGSIASWTLELGFFLYEQGACIGNTKLATDRDKSHSFVFFCTRRGLHLRCNVGYVNQVSD